MNLRDYLSATEFPWKVVRIAETLRRDAIPPVHLQLFPTNRCNASCEYCSCKLVDRQTEMPFREVSRVLCHFKELGTRALTLSGGGEPTLHRSFDRILLEARQLEMEVGLATNGIRLAREGSRELEDRSLTWCRVSIIPELERSDVRDLLEAVCSKLPHVDVGVSMVVGQSTNLNVAEEICKVANETDITHVRFVQEIFEPKNAIMDELVAHCGKLSDKAFFQWRHVFKPGIAPCLMARLKPLVAADGMVYPCCGVQYARGADYRLPDEFSMGSWHAYGTGAYFDGRDCSKCYYWQYNTVLSKLIGEMNHEWFL